MQDSHLNMHAKNMYIISILFAQALPLTTGAQILRKPVPDKLVVLTFDDAVVSHATYHYLCYRNLNIVL